MRLRDMRFRIALPFASIMLGVWLFQLGDLQVRHVAIDIGGFEEPPRDLVATAKYVHYALNAPAWALAGDTRDSVWSPTNYSDAHHLLYFTAVILMWVLIGTGVDQRLNTEKDNVQPKWRSGRVAGWAITLYGMFLWYRMLPKWHLSAPIAGYFAVLKEYFIALLKGTHGWWFPVAGLLWGTVLMTAGLNLVCRSWKQRRGGGLTAP